MSSRSTTVRVEDISHEAFPSFRRDAVTGEERIREVRQGDQQGANAAMTLQQDLAQAVALGAFDPRKNAPGEKWSPRRTLAFMFVTCGTFWAVVAWVVTKLF